VHHFTFKEGAIADISWNYTDSVTNARLQGNKRSLTRSMDAYMQQPFYAACRSAVVFMEDAELPGVLHKG
jgi:hypothetical protein